MKDMRTLMESVAPLFENPQELVQMLGKFETKCSEEGYYGDIDAGMISRIVDSGDMEGAAEEMAAAMADQDGGESPDEIFELAKEMLEDLYHVAEEVAVTENMVDDIDNLNDILNQLEILAQEARSIVQSIDPDAARQLAAYGAFDFGSSDNSYDTTLASFVEDLESGQYDDMDESADKDKEACPNCGKHKHVLRACASCGCS